MNISIDKIVNEWSHNVDNGMPDVKNPLHLVRLKEYLNKEKFSNRFISSLLNNLQEGYWWNDVSPKAKQDYIAKHGAAPKTAKGKGKETSKRKGKEETPAEKKAKGKSQRRYLKLKLRKIKSLMMR
jgi:hypothetical protein